MDTFDKAYQAGLVACNTSLASCASGLAVFIIRYAMSRKLDVCGLCKGILSGLVAISAGCATVSPWEAIIIGAIAALVYQGSSMLIPRLRVDDPVEAVSIHAANGLWGVIAAGLFGDSAEGMGANGSFYGGNQLAVQIVAAICIILWSSIISLIVFLPLRFLGLLRAPDKDNSCPTCHRTLHGICPTCHRSPATEYFNEVLVQEGSSEHMLEKSQSERAEVVVYMPSGGDNPANLPPRQGIRADAAREVPEQNKGTDGAKHSSKADSLKEVQVGREGTSISEVSC